MASARLLRICDVAGSTETRVQRSGVIKNECMLIYFPRNGTFFLTT